MIIRVEMPYAVGTYSDWNNNELLINGDSASELFTQIGQMVEAKGIVSPRINLTIILDIEDAEKKKIYEIEI